MTQPATGEQQILRRRAGILLLGAISDVGIGAAAFFWGDRVLPAARIPLLELSAGQTIGAALVFVAAPLQFLLYSRVKSRLERAVAPSLTRSSANGKATRD